MFSRLFKSQISLAAATFSHGKELQVPQSPQPHVTRDIPRSLRPYLAEFSRLLKAHGILPITKSSRLLIDDPISIASDIAADLSARPNPGLIGLLGCFAAGFKVEMSPSLEEGSRSSDRRTEFSLQLAHILSEVMKEPALAKANATFSQRRALMGSAIGLAVSSSSLGALLGDLPAEVGHLRFPWFRIQTKPGLSQLGRYSAAFPAIAGLTPPEIAMLDKTRSFLLDANAGVFTDASSVPDPISPERGQLTSYASVAHNLSVTELFNRIAESDPAAFETAVESLTEVALEKSDPYLARQVKRHLAYERWELEGKWFSVPENSSPSLSSEFRRQNDLLGAIRDSDITLNSLDEGTFDNLKTSILDHQSPVMNKFRIRSLRDLKNQIQTTQRKIQQARKKEAAERIEEEIWARYRRDLRVELMHAIENRAVAPGALFVTFDTYSHQPGFIDDAFSLRNITRNMLELGIEIIPVESNKIPEKTEQYLMNSLLTILAERIKTCGYQPTIGVAVGAPSTTFRAVLTQQLLNLWPAQHPAKDRNSFSVDTCDPFVNLTVITSDIPDQSFLTLPAEPLVVTSYSDQFMAWLTGRVKPLIGSRDSLSIGAGVGTVPASRNVANESLKHLSYSYRQQRSRGASRCHTN